MLAGGTDLVVRLNLREVVPRTVTDIRKLGLSYIKGEGRSVSLGAATTVSQIASSELLKQVAPVLVDAAKAMANPGIRNVATVGGNLANASPGADLATPLLVLDAEVVLESRRGERRMPLSEFFRGPGLTQREPDELLV
ncbi:MAG: FAD binding domain-containing protein, partial [Actinobacteria bacterium]|nr:FAD binding domain-containing protein [Actinomycetota bacterium]